MNKSLRNLKTNKNLQKCVLYDFIYKCSRIDKSSQVCLVPICNPSTGEAEAGKSQVQGQPGLSI
jgi:hypothetical protein